MEYYITQPKDYWIASNAVNISLNALGSPNRIQGSVASGAAILCYIEGVEGLNYDNGHRFRTWPLSLSPTYFNTNTLKYVYVAIPRSPSIGTQAVVVFPSEQLDIYGKNTEDTQVGSSDYYYIWLQGIITATDGTSVREWGQEIDFGRKGTDEDLYDDTSAEWYQYSQVNGLVTFLKNIAMRTGTTFYNLILGNKELTGVATASTSDDYIDSEALVVTPSYLQNKYLSRRNDDTAEGRVGFLQGLWVKAQNLFGISADGDATVRSLKATGAGSGTTTDAAGQTKGLGLEVTESGVIGGLLRVAQNILTRTIQSIGFSGGDSMFGTGWQLTDDDGSDSSRLVVDKLFVRKKAVFNEVEVRKMVAIGGNYVFSPAASIIEEVDYIKLTHVPGETDVYTETVLGYEYLSVPWVMRLVPLSLRNKLLPRRKLFRTTMTDEDWAQVSIYRCWLKADDGTTRTINTWQTGMMARCQTYDVAASPDGTHTGEAGSTATQSKYYWRAVTANGENVTRQTYTKLTKVLYDGLGHHYIDMANTSPFYDTGSDRPSAGDSNACFGNYLNQELSNLITIETVGSEAPCIRELLGVGYDNGIVPRWSLEGCERTRISPVAGNRFVAPEFYIEASAGGSRTNLSTFVVNTEGMLSHVKGVIDNGKNLLPAALSGNQWRSESSHTFPTHQIVPVSVDSNGYFVCDTSYNNKHISSPIITLQKGTDYALSFEGEATGSVSVYIFDPNYHEEQPAVYKSTTSGLRKTVTFNIAGTGTIDVYINIEIAKMRYPQLELGTEATTFETGGEETASQIKQTANSIDLSITNMQTGLETAGVHLDGQNSTIKLKANKVNFYDASGTNLNPKIWIDPTTGTLHSVDGDFSGSVTALKLFRPACQWWGMMNYHNFDNNDGMGEWFYVVDRAKFVTFVERWGATVPSEEEFPGGYVTFREIVGWGYGGPHAGTAELDDFARDLISEQYAAGDTLFCIPCSYNSQMVYVCGDGFYKDSESGGQTTRKYLVVLPRPEDFQGMVVHVENQMTSPPTTVFVMEAECRNLFMLSGLALFGIATDTPVGDINLPAGDSRDFMSVALTGGNVATWYWLAL